MRRVLFAVMWLAAAAAQSATPGWDQHPGVRLALDIRLTGEAGAAPLADYFGHRPVVLVFGYFTCTNLCNADMLDVLAAAASVNLAPGRFHVLMVSVDPAEDMQLVARKRTAYRERLAGSGAALALLTGSRDAIARLTSSAGFRFERDPVRGIVHPSGFLVAGPDGTISRYFPGAHVEPRDLRLALVQASDGAVGTVSDRLALLCSHFDPVSGRYTSTALALVRTAAVLALMLLAVLIAWARTRRRGQK